MSIKKRNNVATSVYEEIKNRIITLEYEPGYILNETELSREFGISRTPIREALHKLQQEKLITIVSRVGAQVIPLDLFYLKQAFEVKKNLEAFATKLAAVNATKKQIDELKEIVDRFEKVNPDVDYEKLIDIDEEFHKKIREISKNIVLIDVLDMLHTRFKRLWHYTKNQVTNSKTFINTLKDIVDAIEKKNPEKASEMAVKHIEVYIEQIKNDIF